MTEGCQIWCFSPKISGAYCWVLFTLIFTWKIPFHFGNTRERSLQSQVPLTTATVNSTHVITHSAGDELTEHRLFKDIRTLLLNVRARPKSAKLEASLSRKVLFEQRPKAITSPWSVFQKPNKTSCSGDVP